LLNSYNSGRIDFKLFTTEEQSLSRAVDEIDRMTSGAVKAGYVLHCGDALFTLKFTENVSQVLIDTVVKSFITAFKSAIYAEENVSLSQHAVALLKISGLKLSIAESFTGGGIARAIVGVPGASEVLYEGLVCYDPLAKIRRLGVEKEVIREKSVVSREVACEMAKGLLQSGYCDVCLATTGYASEVKNIPGSQGLCFIAAGADNRIEVRRYVFKGDRETVMETGKNAALFMLCGLLRS